MYALTPGNESKNCSNRLWTSSGVLPVDSATDFSEEPYSNEKLLSPDEVVDIISLLSAFQLPWTISSSEALRGHSTPTLLKADASSTSFDSL